MSSGRLKSYKELRVWQLAMTLVEDTYTLTKTFPRDEQFGLSSQLRRAAVSIPSTIAEGYTRANRKEYLHYLAMAQASLAELDTQLEIAQRLKYLEKPSYNNVSQKLVSLSKQLFTLRTSLQTKPRTPDPKPYTE